MKFVQLFGGGNLGFNGKQWTKGIWITLVTPIRSPVS